MTRSRLISALLLASLTAGAGGCSLFGGGEAPPPEPAAPGTEAEGATVAEQGPFAGGVLNTVAERAPPGSATQMLARLAAEFGWEEQVAQNPILKTTVQEGRFEERVEPLLLGLYYRNGWSVLPVVGDGHEFNRDSIVRGAMGSSRLYVATRDKVRIVFLRPVQNVQIVYHQDGEEPQVFSVSDQAVVAVRQSRLKYYLR